MPVFNFGLYICGLFLEAVNSYYHVALNINMKQAVFTNSWYYRGIWLKDL
jgi:hypothetical protein